MQKSIRRPLPSAPKEDTRSTASTEEHRLLDAFAPPEVASHDFGEWPEDLLLDRGPFDKDGNLIAFEYALIQEEALREAQMEGRHK